MTTTKRCGDYNCKESHAFHVVPGPGSTVRVTLVGWGKNVYLHLADKDDRCIGFVSGPRQLRALAKAILAEVK